ncbi:MAG: hypothetical protein HFJ47_00825 [Clostridia bacterium]|nr:hypothetical protein [Clostridia bacterium]
MLDDTKMTLIKNNKITSQKHLIKKKKIFIVLLCIFIFSYIVLTIFCMNNSNIFSRIYINDINVSNMSIDEAKEKVSSKLTNSKPLHLTYEDYDITILPSEIDFCFDIDSTIQEAYSIGRSSNIFTNSFNIISSIISSRNIPIKYSYSEEKLNHIINNIGIELPGAVVEPSYYIENDALIICNGSGNIRLCNDELKTSILNSICDINTSSNDIVELNIPVKPSSPCNIDIDKIYSEIHTEPQNAYIDKENLIFHMNVDGVDFAISLDEAKSLLQTDCKEYVIPLNITIADITINDLDKDIFVDTLSTYNTRYNTSNINRSHNLEIATNKLNNVIVLPGEVFSYNKIVGERSISAGYKEATVYTSNGIEHGIGGGVCQVSSTLYNAVIQANLDIVERKNHRYSVSYVPLGCDATVAYGSIDFKFKNTRNYPIKIQASAKRGVVSISIIGMYEDVEYDISLVTKQIYTIPFETKYIYDSSLSYNSRVIKQKGSYGYKINTYKIVKLDDCLISETLVSTDTYSPLTQIINVGN